MVELVLGQLGVAAGQGREQRSMAAQAERLSAGASLQVHERVKGGPIRGLWPCAYGVRGRAATSGSTYTILSPSLKCRNVPCPVGRQLGRLASDAARQEACAGGYEGCSAAQGEEVGKGLAVRGRCSCVHKDPHLRRT